MAGLIIAAGGTGGHIFPALSFALRMQRSLPHMRLRWIGTSRSREQQLCARHGIPIEVVDVTGIPRRVSPAVFSALAKFVMSTIRLRRSLRASPPAAVVAFGGYVCAPVMAAAVLAKVPFYIQEQNTIPGLVNRLFSSRARCSFLGFPLADTHRLRGRTLLTGTPVRPKPTSPEFRYPSGIDPLAATVLICGGSQGALTMNRLLVAAARQWASRGAQIIWQTGSSGIREISDAMAGCSSVLLFDTIDDLYPYYAIARVVVGRAGASTLSEASLFGLPVVMIPLPWAAENHQWINAGMAQDQGWGIRIPQGENTGREVGTAVDRVLNDESCFASMRERALAHSPEPAADEMVRRIREDLNL